MFRNAQRMKTGFIVTLAVSLAPLAVGAQPVRWQDYVVHGDSRCIDIERSDRPNPDEYFFRRRRTTGPRIWTPIFHFGPERQPDDSGDTKQCKRLACRIPCEEKPAVRRRIQTGYLTLFCCIELSG